MKIFHIISSINRGGAENHLFNLALKQSKEKNKVKIIYFKGDGYWSRFYRKNNIETINYSLNNKIETIFMITESKFSHISSTLVRDIIKNGGDVSQFIPEEIKI